MGSKDFEVLTGSKDFWSLDMEELRPTRKQNE